MGDIAGQQQQLANTSGATAGQRLLQGSSALIWGNNETGVQAGSEPAHGRSSLKKATNDHVESESLNLENVEALGSEVLRRRSLEKTAVSLAESESESVSLGKADVNKGKGKGKHIPAAPKGKFEKKEFTMPNLKQVGWQKFNETGSGTVWGQYSERSTITLTQSDLEEKFGIPKPGAGERSPKKIRRHLTTPQRALGMGVGLRRFHQLEGGYSRLAEAVFYLDASVLTQDATESFLQYDKNSGEFAMVPNEVELRAANDYLVAQMPIEELDDASLYVVHMKEITHTRERLEANLFRLSFNDRVDKAMSQLKVMKTALQQLQQSERLGLVLITVLKVGNALNAGTFRGDASGFSLLSLAQLATVKQVGGGTLVQYLAGIIYEQQPDLLQLDSDLSAVPAASRIEFEDLQSELKELGSNLHQLSTFEQTLWTEALASSDDRMMTVLTALEHFQADARGLLELLQEKVRDIELAYRSAVVFFGEKPEFTKRYRVHVWLQGVTKFLLEMRQAVIARHEELVKQRRRERAECSRQRKAHRPRLLQPRAVKMSHKSRKMLHLKLKSVRFEIDDAGEIDREKLPVGKYRSEPIAGRETNGAKRSTTMLVAKSMRLRRSRVVRFAERSDSMVNVAKSSTT